MGQFQCRKEGKAVGARRGGREGRERRRAAEQTATKQTDGAFEGCVR